MDPLKNPFSPGAGSPPPELAGRDRVIGDAGVALGRVIAGRSSQSQILLGFRGTGKTVLLNRIELLAEEGNYLTSFVEVPEERSLAKLLYPQITKVLRKLSNVEKAHAAVNSALSSLHSFASTSRGDVGDMEIGVEPMPLSGDLEVDLTELFELVGKAARDAGRGWALLMDEVQYLEAGDLAAIIVAGIYSAPFSRTQ